MRVLSRKVGPEGLEAFRKSPGKTPLSEKGGAPRGAHAVSEALNDPRLLALVEAWPTLSESVRELIAGLILDKQDETSKSRESGRTSKPESR